MGGERILRSAPAPPPAPRAGDTDCGIVPAACRSASRHRCRENPMATSHRHGTVLELVSRPRSAAALSGPSRLQPTTRALSTGYCSPPSVEVLLPSCPFRMLRAKMVHRRKTKKVVSGGVGCGQLASRRRPQRAASAHPSRRGPSPPRWPVRRPCAAAPPPEQPGSGLR